MSSQRINSLSAGFLQDMTTNSNIPPGGDSRRGEEITWVNGSSLVGADKEAIRVELVTNQVDQRRWPTQMANASGQCNTNRQAGMEG